MGTSDYKYQSEDQVVWSGQIFSVLIKIFGPGLCAATGFTCIVTTYYSILEIIYTAHAQKYFVCVQRWMKGIDSDECMGDLNTNVLIQSDEINQG